MKTFRYRNEFTAGKTMTVAELKSLLEKYPDDMPVFAEWENCYAYVEPELFRVETVDKGMKEDACACLVVSVDSY